MPKKCPKNVQKLSGGAENTIFGQFLPIWSMLLFGDPVQCSPVAMVGGLWAADPSKCPKAHEANACSGAQSGGSQTQLEVGAPAAPGTRKPGQSAYHGVGNFYLINSKKLQIGIGIGKFSRN